MTDNWLTEPRLNDADLAAALDATVRIIKRFMAMSDEQLVAVALWIAHTYATDAFSVCAYLFVQSAEKRCGKSLLLDLLELLACRGMSTANVSPAALFRVLDQQRPTLLFDEVDNIFAGTRTSDPAKRELLGLINAGFRKGRPAIRMGGANMRSVETFDPFGPKALAGIGSCLPDTTEDRTIPIRLERKSGADQRERYRIRIHEDAVRAVGAELGAAVERALPNLHDAWPELPPGLNDRAQDIWEPLLAIAEAAGGEWASSAREAAITLHATRVPVESTTTRLLADIRTVFDVDRLLTKDLVARLCSLEESPWGDLRGGKGMSSSELVGNLKTFGLSSKQLRIRGDQRGRGFERSQFGPAFERYLEPTETSSADGVDSVDGP